MAQLNSSPDLTMASRRRHILLPLLAEGKSPLSELESPARTNDSFADVRLCPERLGEANVLRTL